MIDIETKVSPLIDGLFPSLYQEEGEDFIAFVKAYFEWLEQNFQVLKLEDSTNFNVGDIVTQENVTGRIVSYIGDELLILVDGLETFKCFNVCSDLIPITSSSGGDTFILKGGTTRRLGTTFLARNLLKIRDVDTTIDLFLVKFKEKYLRNIEFDTASNKRLLIKNSLDLYRSKGSQRAVDLFFRLVYGLKSDVYYPGDDIFRLSDGEWVKPQYIEISSNSGERAIELVGKQITGVTSNAKAFVEKYIKRKIKTGYVHILYVSNVNGVFENGELLKDQVLYNDSPRIVGSLNTVTIINKSRNYSVGDIVNVESVTGTGGLARVLQVNDSTGTVDFELIDGGWGYTTSVGNNTPSFLRERTQTLLSDRIISMSNVVTGNVVSEVFVTSGGSNYSNDDVITIVSEFSNAIARPSTDSSGTVSSVALTRDGGGFFTTNPSIVVSNSSGGLSSGNGLSLSYQFGYPENYFTRLDTFTQKRARIVYDSVANNRAFSSGSSIGIGNSTTISAYGYVVNNVENLYSNGTMNIVISNNFNVGVNDKIYLQSNTQVVANVSNVVDLSATSIIMSTPLTAIFNVGQTIDGFEFNEEDVVYQVNQQNEVIGKAKITSSSVTLTGGVISADIITGIFRAGEILYVENKTSKAPLLEVSLNVGVYNTNNAYTTISFPIGFSGDGTVGNIYSVGGGKDAQFKIATVFNAEDVRLNTDLLMGNTTLNRTLLDTKLSDAAYGFPQNPSANSSSVIFSALSYKTFSLGEISSFGEINPGIDYTIEPTTFVYQPYLAGYFKRDYVLTISNQNKSFSVGEKIEQYFTQNVATVYISNTSPFRVGERIYTANTLTSYISNSTIIDIPLGTNTLVVKDIEGDLRQTTQVKSFSQPNLAYQIIDNVQKTSQTLAAYGLVKNIAGDQLYVKRIQFEDYFHANASIRGVFTGATANVVNVMSDETTMPIGFNAEVDTSVFTANGCVTSLQIVDSGYGFSNGQVATFSIPSNPYSGTVRVLTDGLGSGSGYYRTSKGFLSNLSKIHDGDYYQEYSYDILSRIPLAKYSNMFKKAIHTSGTRFFGSVLIDTLSEVSVRAANAEIEVSDKSPYVIKDRYKIEVTDRGDMYIEIRD